MVTASESISNLRKTVVRKLLGQSHCDLPWPCHGAGAAFGDEVGDSQLVILRDSFLDILDGDELVLKRKQVFQCVFREIECYRLAGEVGTGHHAAQRAFELTDIRTNALSDEERDLVR